MIILDLKEATASIVLGSIMFRVCLCLISCEIHVHHTLSNQNLLYCVFVSYQERTINDGNIKTMVN